MLNPGHVESGFKSLTVNGEEMETNYIPDEILKDVNEVVLTMS